MKGSTEILYRKIQKQKMKMMFADLLTKIISSGVVSPEAINQIFEEEYNKHF
jgi:hypothetical protein